MKRPVILGFALLVAGVGCGGAAPPDAAAPSKVAAPPPPTSIEEAQAQIAAANDELGGSAKSDSAPADAAEAHPKAAPAEPPADAPASTPPAKSVDACASPCRALASMRRAVDALCRMAGDTDKRCVDARQTLADSVSRTAACGCSS